MRETEFVEAAVKDSAVLDTALFALQREQGPLCAARVAEVVAGGGRGVLAALSWVLHGIDGAGLAGSMGGSGGDEEWGEGEDGYVADDE